MERKYFDTDDSNFDPQLYIKILVAIAKADKNNGPREYKFVQTLADRLSIDITEMWGTTEKTFLIDKIDISRATALAVLRDGIILASLDHDFSMGEKEKVYTYAEKMDIPRADVEYIVKWLDEFRMMMGEWDKLVRGDIS